MSGESWKGPTCCKGAYICHEARGHSAHLAWNRTCSTSAQVNAYYSLCKTEEVILLLFR